MVIFVYSCLQVTNLLYWMTSTEKQSSTCHYYFMCPSDGDVKSEVPCSVSATPVHVKDPFSSSSLFGAVFVKSRHQYEAAT